nr:reverse transcriptase domain-containing protein [Tanacetum cinerariifolium]
MIDLGYIVTCRVLRIGDGRRIKVSRELIYVSSMVSPTKTVERKAPIFKAWSTKKAPIFKAWSTKLLKKRESEELKSRGFGKLPILEGLEFIEPKKPKLKKKKSKVLLLGDGSMSREHELEEFKTKTAKTSNEVDYNAIALQLYSNASNCFLLVIFFLKTQDMKDCLNDNVSKIKALLLDTDKKLKISLNENPEYSDLKMIIGKRVGFFKELYHRDVDNAMVVLHKGNDLPEEAVKDNEVLKEKDDVLEKRKDVEKKMNKEKDVEKVVVQNLDKPQAVKDNKVSNKIDNVPEKGKDVKKVVELGGKKQFRVMSSPNHPTSNIEDAFSSNFPDYISALPDYFPASLRNTSSESLNNSYGLLPIASLSLSLFHDDPYIKVMHAYDTIIPLQVPIPIPTIVPPSLMLSPIFKNSIFPRKYCHQRNEADFYSRTNHRGCPGLPPIRYEPSFWIQSMSLRTAREDHHHQATRLDPMVPKRTSTSAAPAMTQAAIWQLVADSVAAALKAQAANMANTDNTNRNTRPRETHAARKCTYKEFMSCQPFYFNEQADKIAWTELKRLLTNNYYPRTEVKKMEDKFYNLVLKGNDLKTYARRFQELETLCPNMVPNNEKLIEVFIRGFPQSIERIVTASKPQTLEEAINIAQRLLNQLLKHGSVQGTNDHKRKFDD